MPKIEPKHVPKPRPFKRFRHVYAKCVGAFYEEQRVIALVELSPPVFNNHPGELRALAKWLMRAADWLESTHAQD